MRPTHYILIIVILIVIGLIWWSNNQFDLPTGETTPLATSENTADGEHSNNETRGTQKTNTMTTSDREIFVTDGVRHSIPLDEILSGGPPKDGIPSIDEPQFISTQEAGFLTDEDVGLGIVHDDTAKFYPYQILVWHEIVNDKDMLVTYCPLCATGIAFDPHIGGERLEFGVSGKLWQSNLLMYNRTGDPDTESLWSQVLGEAVLGPMTGTKLEIIPSDTVLYGDWKTKYPDTLVLSRNTGTTRLYGTDPYDDYYTNESVSFGATFNDDRLHPKAFVLGIAIDGQYKAYHDEALPEGTTTDTFAGKTIMIEKNDIGGVRMFVGPEKEPLSYVGGFWFSWLAVHPETQLYK